MSAEQPPDSNRVVKQFLPQVLDKTVIALPLQKLIDEQPDALHDVIIDLNLEFQKAAVRRSNKFGSISSRLIGSSRCEKAKSKSPMRMCDTSMSLPH